MAWNPGPEVAALRDFGNKFDCGVVVTFAIKNNGEQFQVTTYGRTKALCKLAGEFGKQITKGVKNGTIEPPATEPFDMPPDAIRWSREVGSRPQDLSAGSH